MGRKDQAGVLKSNLEFAITVMKIYLSYYQFPRLEIPFTVQ